MARQPNTTTSGGPFDEKTIEAVFQKGTPEPAYSGFRKDTCGASMQRNKYGKTEQFGWEIDHKKPVSKGGTDDLHTLEERIADVQGGAPRVSGTAGPTQDFEVERRRGGRLPASG